MQKKTKKVALAAAVVAAGAMAVGGGLAYASDNGTTSDSDGPSTKVVGGEPAEEGAYPFAVRMTIDGDDACGGSVLREDVVLTAAHCVEGADGADITVKYGANELDSPDIQEIEVTEAVESPDYDPNTLVSDWGLLKLAEPVADVEPITLADTPDYDEGDQTIMGWGATSEGGEQSNELLEATVPAVDDEQCAEAYGDELDADTMICAGKWEEGGTDACQGDSGGPMVVEGEEGYVQTGIVSWGYGCAQPENPGVYAQVSFLVDDINAAADELAAV